ncbi:MAG: hypothetical protein ABI759_02840, partial [Candidatus Solibacter sp.]
MNITRNSTAGQYTGKVQRVSFVFRLEGNLAAIDFALLDGDLLFLIGPHQGAARPLAAEDQWRKRLQWTTVACIRIMKL